MTPHFKEEVFLVPSMLKTTGPSTESDRDNFLKTPSLVSEFPTATDTAKHLGLTPESTPVREENDEEEGSNPDNEEGIDEDNNNEEEELYDDEENPDGVNEEGESQGEDDEEELQPYSEEDIKDILKTAEKLNSISGSRDIVIEAGEKES
jgi:hypothetical protein